MRTHRSDASISRGGGGSWMVRQGALRVRVRGSLFANATAPGRQRPCVADRLEHLQQVVARVDEAHRLVLVEPEAGWPRVFGRVLVVGIVGVAARNPSAAARRASAARLPFGRGEDNAELCLGLGRLSCRLRRRARAHSPLRRARGSTSATRARLRPPHAFSTKPRLSLAARSRSSAASVSSHLLAALRASVAFETAVAPAAAAAHACTASDTELAANFVCKRELVASASGTVLCPTSGER
jgi:hypothetical protein